MTERHLTNRIDLLNGQVRGGGSVEGSLVLVKILVESWTMHALLALCSDIEYWIEALAESENSNVGEIRKKMAAVTGEVIAPDVLDYDELFDNDWFNTRRSMNHLRFSLYYSSLLFSVGPDYVVKIGDDAPTPDLIITQDAEYSDYYLLSPSDIIIETVAAGKKIDDYRDVYLAGGCRELWILDFPGRQFSAFTNGERQRWEPLEIIGNRFESRAVKGLTLEINRLWEGSASNFRSDLFSYNDVVKAERKKIGGGILWGDIKFAPHIEAEPNRVSFEQFIAWSPESKFEMADGKIYIGSDIGTRNVIGLLAQSIGIRKLVEVLSSQKNRRDLYIALADREYQLHNQQVLRDHLLVQARLAAGLLRRDFGFGEIILFGDWLEKPTISKWTQLQFVVPETQKFDHYEVFKALKTACDEEVIVQQHVSMTKSQNEEFFDHHHFL